MAWLIKSTYYLDYFNVDKCRKHIQIRNMDALVISIVARTVDEIDEWTTWLQKEVKA